ncbi:MAG: hypothetical protein ACR2IS_20505 [Nitrososphaeraceae archaeon]
MKDIPKDTDSSITASPSLSIIFKKLGDDRAFALFNNSALSFDTGYQSSPKETQLTAKEYYSRMSKLISSGLVQKLHGKYYVTSFGKIAHVACLMMNNALNYYWKLKSIDVIMRSETNSALGGFPKEKVIEMIDAMIDNQKRKDIIMKGNAEMPENLW